MMHGKRRYNRFKLKNREVIGKMVLANEVNIIDISVIGMSLRANRQLHIGSDYTLKLEGIKSISLRGTVVWCSLIESRKGSKGEMIPIYSAGLKFKKMSIERVTELLSFIDSHKIEVAHLIGGARLNIRFHIKDSENATLMYPDNYKVKTISLGGMRIECLRNFEIESRIIMEMFIHKDKPLKFVGRVTSCQGMVKEGQQQYDIGLDFLDLTEKDRETLSSFIDHSALTETETEN
jgi:c-di-GMP-binding flagellar brake protein YcgR